MPEIIYYRNDSLKVSSPGKVRRGLFKNVDEIKFLNHQAGCGGTRRGATILSKLVAAYADHPIVGGNCTKSWLPKTADAIFCERPETTQSQF